MNHERHDPEPGSVPRHRADVPDMPYDGEAARDTTADAFIADVIAHAPDAIAGRAIEATYLRYGMAFAVYLTLDGVDRYAPDHRPAHCSTDPPLIEVEFKNAYYGSFADREAIVDDTIASFDWGTELRRALQSHPDLEQMVRFDRDAIWGFVSDHYDIREAHDGFHVFERWP
ncbi:MAG: hypothetical protein QM572_07275 [Nocardioides sp.]|uniref:hypothetical protein n=1 Tax=Nocardioides sp. TaxID=35761 RepID=UPI0039E2931B